MMKGAIHLGVLSSVLFTAVATAIEDVVSETCPLNCRHDTICERGKMNVTSHPLGLDGEALEFHQELSKNGWYCNCPDGLTGLECEHRYKTCNDANHLCYNGGECLEGLGEKYDRHELYCNCPPQVGADGAIMKFTGKFCEKKMSNSHSRCEKGNEKEFCKNGGTCKTYVDHVSPCDCPDGYEGTHCEYASGTVPDCELDCKNGGACKLGIKNVDPLHTKFEDAHTDFQHCECPPGFTGSFCEIPKNNCGDLVCLHGAQCLNINGHSHCDCESISTKDEKYAGRHCDAVSTSICHYEDDESIDASGMFCTNMGECPKVAHAQCSCKPGYYGPHCEFKMDDKLRTHEDDEDYTICSTACENGGTCRKGKKQLSQHFSMVNDKDIQHLNVTKPHNEVFEFCACPKGTTGLYCEHDYIPCGKHGTHPCFHGSTCGEGADGNTICNCNEAESLTAGLYCQHNVSNVCPSGRISKKTHQEFRGFCVNDGECVIDEKGEMKCECEGDYSGPHCEWMGLEVLPPLGNSGKNTPQKRFDNPTFKVVVSMIILGSLAGIAAAIHTLARCRRHDKENDEATSNANVLGNSYTTKHHYRAAQEEDMIEDFPIQQVPRVV